MGIPTVGVLSGYTNGSITTYDYSVEFAELNLSLAAIALSLEKIDITLMLNLGPLGAEVPYTLSNSAAITKNMLIQLAGGTDNIKGKQDQTAMLIKGMQGSIDAMSSAIREQAAVQTLQAADQIEHNSFQKQATLDALKRNDLPAPVPPAPMDEIKQKIKNAELIHAQALLVGTVSSITDNVLSTLKDYILNSGPILYAKEIVTEAFDSVALFFKNTYYDIFPKSPKDAAKQTQRALSNANVPAPNTDPTS